MKPSDFVRHLGSGRKRFLVRIRNGKFEVYGVGLDHLCWARDRETADMIADALESVANLDDDIAAMKIERKKIEGRK